MKTTIRDLRIRCGLSQTQLASLMGVTQGAVNQWESGATHPKIMLLPKLASALGVTVDELIGKEDPHARTRSAV